MNTTGPLPPSGTEWLADACVAVQRAGHALDAFDLSLWEGGVRLSLEAAGQALHLDLHARSEGNAYAKTPSLSVFARMPDGVVMTADTEAVVRALIDEVARRDDGARSLPKGEPVVMEGGDAGHDRLSLEAVLAWQQAHEELAEQLRAFRYIAVQTMIHTDLYPHEIVLGEPVEEADIQASWRRTSAAIAEGRAPAKLGIYVHVPYCTVECGFCYCGKTEEFTRNDLDLYVERLLEEIETYAPLVEGRTITSVYFGGGTPSLLSPPAMRRVFETLYARYHVPEGTQVIFEGNPDSLKPNKIEILGTLGRVTRLTIGIQTLDPKVQAYVRRFNRKEDVEAAVAAARRVGIPHVNFDCIAGLQGQTMQSWQDDIEYLLSLEPDSIHLNGFRPLPRTLYAQRGQQLDTEQMRLRDEMMEWAEARLERAGHGGTLQQGLHRTRNAANLQEYDLRTQNSSLLGFGYPARSHSFGGYYYVRDASAGFVPALREQNATVRRYRGVRADRDEEIAKFLVTNAREGFSRDEFRQLFGVDALEARPEAFRNLERLGVVEIRPDRVIFHTGRAIDALVYRCFFYSEATMQRLMARFGADYDPSHDYAKDLEYLVPSAD